MFPGLPNPRWVAMRLLDGDEAIAAALRSGELGRMDRIGASVPTDSLEPATDLAAVTSTGPSDGVRA